MTTIPLHDSGSSILGELTLHITRRDEAEAPALPPISRSIRPGQSFVIGSSPTVDLSVAEPTLSREHARIVHDGRALTITDLSSTNGVVVDDLRVLHGYLQPGSRVLLGHTTLTVLDSSQPAASFGAAPLTNLVGGSLVMRQLADRVRRFARLPHPVLVRGETGTGKELVARALHDSSGRRGPFVAVNAATLSAGLAESELFGHVRGAFTGASADRKGAFRSAHGGTLFIDEVAQLSLDVQAKLLRVLEDGAVRPLGADTVIPVDVRVVTATCEPIEERVRHNAFRADVFERLAVCVVRVPALRERIEDLRAIAHKLAADQGIERSRLTSSLFAELGRYKYPGNVRELRSILVHASINAGGGPITGQHAASAIAERVGGLVRVDRGQALATVGALQGNVSRASRLLGVPRSTLRDWLAQGRARPATLGPSANLVFQEVALPESGAP
ncbi:MAG: sigma 54-interacting transcriptional regulator [Polyangiaceae bacterium]